MNMFVKHDLPNLRPFRRGLCFALILSVLGSAAWADPVGPRSIDRQITSTVVPTLLRAHLSRHPLDKEIAARWMKLFLKSLDPKKLYFYQSDVDEFTSHQNELINLIQQNNITFAYVVFQRFLQRVDERGKMIDELLAQPLDFTRDEYMITDRDMLHYPKDPSEARQRWRKRIKCDLLVLKSAKDDKDKKEGKEAIEKLSKRYHNYAKYSHQTTADELLELYLTALTTSFDPHSDYWSPDTKKDFDIFMRLELEGIGATLQSVDGYTVVKSIVPGGAAAKDGRLKEEDKIIGVGQNAEGPIVDVVEMRLKHVVKLIRGKPGTVVRLEVIPDSGGERKIINITREKIELKDREAKGKIFDAGRRPDGKPYKIGVIDLPSFYMDMSGQRRGIADFKSSTRDVRAILEDFKKKGVDAVILDLRRNGGGSLPEAISLTGLFIKNGPVVQIKDPDGRVLPCYDPDTSQVWAGPLVVLTSKFSASASEILAGAIKDYARGLIVGDHTTHGKGTVQSLLDLAQELFPNLPNISPMGALKITIQQFYRPNGESTQKHGVKADVELPSLSNNLDVGEADLDYPVDFDQVDPMQYKRFNYVTAPICEQLKQLSKQRVEHSEKFQKELQTIKRYKEFKAQKRITLNEEKFLKERAELDADKAEEKTIEKLNDTENNDIVRDYYLDEVINVTVDFLNLEQLAQTQIHNHANSIKTDN